MMVRKCHAPIGFTPSPFVATERLDGWQKWWSRKRRSTSHKSQRKTTHTSCCGRVGIPSRDIIATHYIMLRTRWYITRNTSINHTNRWEKESENETRGWKKRNRNYTINKYEVGCPFIWAANLGDKMIIWLWSQYRTYITLTGIWSCTEIDACRVVCVCVYFRVAGSFWNFILIPQMKNNTESIIFFWHVGCCQSGIEWIEFGNWRKAIHIDMVRSIFCWNLVVSVLRHGHVMSMNLSAMVSNYSDVCTHIDTNCVW